MPRILTAWAPNAIAPCIQRHLVVTWNYEIKSFSRIFRQLKVSARLGVSKRLFRSRL